MLGDSLRRRQRALVRKSRRLRIRWGRWGATGIGLLAFSFVIGYALAVFVLFPPAPDPRGGAVPVPELTGKNLVEAHRELRSRRLELGSPLELPNALEPEGVVIAQAPLPGQRLYVGAVVRVAVSSGRPRARVPDLAGFEAGFVEGLLTRLGFQVSRRSEPNRGPAGLVTRIEPPPGTELELPAPVVLYVGTGFGTAAPADSAAPPPADTAARAPPVRP
ncbi:MAG: PASTA domain-containing protein [Gemmatimonadetes bacterium]|nr:PASTA domain-containing protein [Gemmatimonadota bacterium]